MTPVQHHPERSHDDDSIEERVAAGYEHLFHVERVERVDVLERLERRAGRELVIATVVARFEDRGAGRRRVFVSAHLLPTGQTYVNRFTGHEIDALERALARYREGER